MDATFSLGDLRVNRLGLGAMRLTGPGIWREPRDIEAARALLRLAVKLGIDFIDTADSYGPEVSERLIAETLAPYPEQLVLATKGGYLRPGPDRWEPDGRPEHLRRACEGSLRRLGIEQISLYQLHVVDRKVPLAESVGALAELRAEGKVRHVGLSNVTVPQIEEARRITSVVSVQNRYNLGDRRNADVLRHCEQNGLAFICWAPLARGRLARAGAIRRIADGHGVRPSQIALAWLLGDSSVTIAIPGTGSAAHLRENVEAASIVLTDAEVGELDAYRPGLTETFTRQARGAVRRARSLPRRRR